MHLNTWIVSGKGSNYSIVLEAICDYHIFFWHASYGYAGTLNDHYLLILSPFRYILTNGTLKITEKELNLIPFVTGNDVLIHYTFLLIEFIQTFLDL